MSPVRSRSLPLQVPCQAVVAGARGVAGRSAAGLSCKWVTRIQIAWGRAEKPIHRPCQGTMRSVTYVTQCHGSVESRSGSRRPQVARCRDARSWVSWARCLHLQVPWTDPGGPSTGAPPRHRPRSLSRSGPEQDEDPGCLRWNTGPCRDPSGTHEPTPGAARGPSRIAGVRAMRLSGCAGPGAPGIARPHPCRIQMAMAK